MVPRQYELTDGVWDCIITTGRDDCSNLELRTKNISGFYITINIREFLHRTDACVDLYARAPNGLRIHPHKVYFHNPDQSRTVIYDAAKYAGKIRQEIGENPLAYFKKAMLN